MLYFAQQHGVNPHVITELGREISWRDDLVALWKLYRIFVTERPDIVHTHTAKAGAIGRLAAVLARIPVRIHTFHGHVFHGYFSPLKTKLFVLIERVLACLTTKIIAISNTQLSDLSDRYHIAPRGKFKVIPVGLDLDSLLNISRNGGASNSESSAPATLIGFIGRLVPIKNPHMAVSVFERLVHDAPEGQRVKLIVAGDGELRSELQKRIHQAGCGSQIMFTGWRNDLVDLYSRLNMVIFTSCNEGTPVALIEAMAAGIPFVATRVGGISDLMLGPEDVISGRDGRPLFSVFANGALAESQDVEGFAAAVKYLLDKRELMQRMGSVGREYVRQRFSRERLIRDITNLYQDCLASNGGVASWQADCSDVQEEIRSIGR